jgi:hypothetical protein
MLAALHPPFADVVEDLGGELDSETACHVPLLLLGGCGAGGTKNGNASGRRKGASKPAGAGRVPPSRRVHRQKPLEARPEIGVCNIKM